MANLQLYNLESEFILFSKHDKCYSISKTSSREIKNSESKCLAGTENREIFGVVGVFEAKKIAYLVVVTKARLVYNLFKSDIFQILEVFP